MATIYYGEGAVAVTLFGDVCLLEDLVHIRLLDPSQYLLLAPPINVENIKEKVDLFFKEIYRDIQSHLEKISSSYMSAIFATTTITRESNYKDYLKSLFRKNSEGIETLTQLYEQGKLQEFYSFFLKALQEKSQQNHGVLIRDVLRNLSEFEKLKPANGKKRKFVRAQIEGYKKYLETSVVFERVLEVKDLKIFIISDHSKMTQMAGMPDQIMGAAIPGAKLIVLFWNHQYGIYPLVSPLGGNVVTQEITECIPPYHPTARAGGVSLPDFIAEEFMDFWTGTLMSAGQIKGSKKANLFEYLQQRIGELEREISNPRKLGNELLSTMRTIYDRAKREPATIIFSTPPGVAPGTVAHGLTYNALGLDYTASVAFQGYVPEHNCEASKPPGIWINKKDMKIKALDEQQATQLLQWLLALIKLKIEPIAQNIYHGYDVSKEIFGKLFSLYRLAPTALETLFPEVHEPMQALITKHAHQDLNALRLSTYQCSKEEGCIIIDPENSPPKTELFATLPINVALTPPSSLSITDYSERQPNQTGNASDGQILLLLFSARLLAKTAPNITRLVTHTVAQACETGSTVVSFISSSYQWLLGTKPALVPSQDAGAKSPQIT